MALGVVCRQCCRYGAGQYRPRLLQQLQDWLTGTPFAGMAARCPPGGHAGAAERAVLCGDSSVGALSPWGMCWWRISGGVVLSVLLALVAVAGCGALTTLGYGPGAGLGLGRSPR